MALTLKLIEQGENFQRVFRDLIHGNIVAPPVAEGMDFRRAFHLWDSAASETAQAISRLPPPPRKQVAGLPCPACGLAAGDVEQRGETRTIPWNLVVRARTSGGSDVYVCEACAKPLEATASGYQASPAAAEAMQELTGLYPMPVVAIETEWTAMTARTADGLQPVRPNDDGPILLLRPDDNDTKYRLMDVSMADMFPPEMLRINAALNALLRSEKTDKPPTP